MNTIRIVAAVVDTRQLTIYKEDGSTMLIPQGDPRLRRILEVATPQLQSQGWADVEISEVAENSYADFQEQSKGIRFFRVAKERLKKLLKLEDTPNNGHVESQVVGSVPKPPSPAATVQPATPVGVATAPVATEDDDTVPVLTDVLVQGTDDQEETFEPVEQVPETKVEQTMSAIDEIIAHATPVTSNTFNETGIVKQRTMAEGYSQTKAHPDESAEDTIIAVVDDKIIPGMELIKSQFGHAAKMGSTQGVENFFKRLSTVIEHRSHSVEDLLKFMERADLPIADDGSIIIYKVLSRSRGKYVDCHTHKVEQWVGAYVCMDPSLVDRNRNNECSNGLHVARRGYISGFSGNVCVLAKLAPEDVITVPTYDANKMRVCGYHILKELPDGLYSLLKSNRAITQTDDGKRILADAISGNHVRKTHEVRITGSRGAGVIVKDIPKDEEPAPILTPEAPAEVEAIPDDHSTADKPVVPAEVEQVAQATLTRKEQAQKLYDLWQQASTEAEKSTALDALVLFKKAAKVGWDRLGIPDPTATGAIAPQGTPAKIKLTTAAKQTAPVKQALPAASEGSPRERIAKLMEIGLDSAGVAQKVYDIKKASKKSWEVLGLTGEQSAKVLKAIGKE
jgi:hypothetical protein